MFIRQIKTGFLDVFTYIIGCEESKIAVVIDPGGDAELIAREAKAAGFTIKYIINTHGHSDHTAGNRELKELTGRQRGYAPARDRFTVRRHVTRR